MHRSAIYCLYLSLTGLFILPGGPVHALTFFKCIALDNSVTYLDSQPKPGECKTEVKKEVDPDANVIPAPEFTGEQRAGETAPGAGEGPPIGVSGDTPLPEDDAAVASEQTVSPADGVAESAPVAPPSSTSSPSPGAPSAATAPSGATAPSAVLGP